MFAGETDRKCARDVRYKNTGNCVCGKQCDVMWFKMTYTYLCLWICWGEYFKWYETYAVFIWLYTGHSRIIVLMFIWPCGLELLTLNYTCAWWSSKLLLLNRSHFEIKIREFQNNLEKTVFWFEIIGKSCIKTSCE